MTIETYDFSTDSWTRIHVAEDMPPTERAPWTADHMAIEMMSDESEPKTVRSEVSR